MLGKSVTTIILCKNHIFYVGVFRLMELWLVYLADFTCLHISKCFLDTAVTFYPGRSKNVISHAIILARLHSPPFNCCQSSPRLYSHRCLLMWKAYVCQDSGRRAKETSHLERTEFSSCVFEKRSAEPASSLQAAGVKLLSIKQGVYRCLRKHFCVDQQARISQTICRMSMRED